MVPFFRQGWIIVHYDRQNFRLRLIKTTEQQFSADINITYEYTFNGLYTKTFNNSGFLKKLIFTNSFKGYLDEVIEKHLHILKSHTQSLNRTDEECITKETWTEYIEYAKLHGQGIYDHPDINSLCGNQTYSWPNGDT